jgi:DNA-binding beta-propeller fold protein YncE
MEGALRIHRAISAVIASSMLALACSSSASPASDASTTSSVLLPDAGASVNIDDLRYLPNLDRIAVAVGAEIFLVKPEDLSITVISGLGVAPDAGSGALDAGSQAMGRPGASSVDEGAALLFANSRRDHLLYTVDPATGTLIRTSTLGGAPDYVRYVQETNEVWVTEPMQEQIEILSLKGGGAHPVAVHAAIISTPGGPEGLVIDPVRHRAYTHGGASQTMTLAVDLGSRSIAAMWPNGCTAGTGIDLDPARGHVLVGCNEGKAVVLDAKSNGLLLSSLTTDGSIDLIGYSAELHHIYLPSPRASKVSVIGVSSAGTLTELGKFDSSPDGHCAAADQLGHAYVCNGMGARLIVFKDPYRAQ